MAKSIVTLTHQVVNSEDLHPEHLQDLQKSGLTPQDFARFGSQVYSLSPEHLKDYLQAAHYVGVLPCARSAYVIQYPSNEYWRIKVFWHCEHDKHPKYLGPAGREVPLFIPPSVQALGSKRMEPIAIVEGEKKALALNKAGLPAIGMGGCWNFRSDDGDLLPPLNEWDLRDRKVYLVPDADWRKNPDVAQAWLTLGLLLARKRANVRIVCWPDRLGKGIDDAIVGGLKVQEAVQKAKPLIEWVGRCAQQFPDAVLSALASVPLEGGLAKAFVSAFAKACKWSVRDVLAEIGRRRRLREEVSARDDGIAQEPSAEIRAWLCRPDLIDAILDAVGQVHAGDSDNVLSLLLAWGSLRFDRPVSILIQGPPSTGKSHLLETCMSLWPEESYIFRSSLSPKALAYTKEKLAHRAVILAEAVSLATSDEAGYLLRTLLTEGRIAHEAVEKTATGLQAVTLRREGPTALFATTTRLKIEEQLASRVWVVESKSDNAYLNMALDAIAYGPAQVPHADDIRKALTWLYRYGNPHVIIPRSLLQAVRNLFPGKDPTELRIFGRLLASIRASAFIHQLQRPRIVIDGQECVLATEADYRVARRALAGAFETATGRLTPRQREVWEAVNRLGKDASLTLIAKEVGMDKGHLRRVLKGLMSAGYIAQDPITKHYRVADAPDPAIRLPETLPIDPIDPVDSIDRVDRVDTRQREVNEGVNAENAVPNSKSDGSLTPLTPLTREGSHSNPTPQNIDPGMDVNEVNEVNASQKTGSKCSTVAESRVDTPKSTRSQRGSMPHPLVYRVLRAGLVQSLKAFWGPLLASTVLLTEVAQKARIEQESSGPPWPPEDFWPAQNREPVLCTGCGRNIAPEMAVMARSDPQRRLWHVNCAPILLRKTESQAQDKAQGKSDTEDDWLL